MNVLIQLVHSPEIHEASRDPSMFSASMSRLAPSIPDVELDRTFHPVQIPAAAASGTLADDFSMAPERSTYLVRGSVSEEDPQAAVEAVRARSDVAGVFADPVVETFDAYCGEDAVGTVGDVAKALNVDRLASEGMDGHGVLLAIVDGGVNSAYLGTKGWQSTVDVDMSYTPSGVTELPGQHRVGHGSMCAYDAGIAAPAARLLDLAVLLAGAAGGSRLSGLLSDAVGAYGKLLQILRGIQTPPPLVISNSWGVYQVQQDLPVGDPGNYTDNPEHPFNIIVGTLERAGVDVVFAAGNCGRDCPDWRCSLPFKPISGANSHPQVLTVAAIDVQLRRLGYSSQGPGRLSADKPDIAAFSHFQGSGVFAPKPDIGTSAACPVAAGVVAAVRSVYPPSVVPPAQLRGMIRDTARQVPGVASGWGPDYGWGAMDPSALVDALEATASTPPPPGGQAGRAGDQASAGAGS